MKELLLITLMLLSVSNSYSQMNKSERYERGWTKLQEIDGEAGENVVNGLKDISPEFAQFIIEYSFGDVYTQTFLDNKSKEVAAVASLIAQGTIPQLKIHLGGALNTGSSIIEVKELILHTAVYVGFPKAINAMVAMKEVLADRREKGIDDNEGDAITQNTSSRYEKGSKSLALLDKKQEQILKDTYENISPELARFVIEYAYGDVYAREGLDNRYRQIATIATLTTLGNASAQLEFHIKAGLNIGLTVNEINEIMLLMTVYSGFPAAINGTNALKALM